jgi:two-component system, cell cycle response regulator DivK
MQPLILIVEDNKINALVLQKMLKHDFETLHAVNDVQALAALEEADFALILMDINLGSNSRDGETIMREIKAEPRFSSLPVFAVTSYANPEDRERFLSAGFDDYYPKPIDKQAILAGIQAALQLPSSHSD